MDRYLAITVANRSVLSISCFEGVVVGVAVLGIPALEHSLLHHVRRAVPHSVASWRGF